MPTVLIVPEMMRNVPAPYVDRLRDAGFEIRYPQDPMLARGLLDEAQVVAELREADATLASVEQYSPRVLEQLPRLRVIARCGVGYDRVDLAAASRRRIAVTITPTANHEAVAELALSLMFAVTKSTVRNDQAIRRGGWPRIPLRPLRRQVLGIVGLGRIGRSLAVRALALGMHVVASDVAADQQFLHQHGIRLLPLDDLLAQSDFVSVHCPLLEETRRLFRAETFSKMKRGSIFINTSRGGLVDEADLLAALRSGHLAGAGLDVLAQEPPAADNPLFKEENVVFSPHMAGVDLLSLEAMGLEAAECIVQLSRGQWPQGAVVNERQVREGWSWKR